MYLCNCPTYISRKVSYHWTITPKVLNLLTSILNQLPKIWDLATYVF